MTYHIGEATKKVIDLDALEKLADEATPGPWIVQDGCSWRRIGTRHGDGDVLCPTNHHRDNHPDLTAGRGHDTYANLNFIAAANPATIKALIAELKALQAFAADEIALAFSAGFNDAIGREKWDDCYDFAAVKSLDYRNDRISAFLARNGKGEG